jgi:hypothetical protein
MIMVGPDEADTCQDYVRPALARRLDGRPTHDQFRVQADLPAGRLPPWVSGSDVRTTSSNWSPVCRTRCPSEAAAGCAGNILVSWSLPITSRGQLPQVGGRVGRRPIPEGPIYEVEVKSGVEVVRAGWGDSAGVPVELILVGVVRCCGRCPVPVSGPT